MRLIAELDKTYTVLLDISLQLINDIMKLPEFKLHPAPNGYANSDKRRLIVDSYGNLITLVSNKYVLTHPRDTLLKIADVLVGKVRRYQIYYYSGKIWCKIILNEVVTDCEIPFRPGFVYQDSVDKSMRLKIIFAPCIQQCGNDIYARANTFSSRHVGKILTNIHQFASELEKWLTDITYLPRLKERMSRETLTNERFNELLNSLNINKAYKATIKYKPDMTLWDLYMDVTHVLTINNASLRQHIAASKLLEV